MARTAEHPGADVEPPLGSYRIDPTRSTVAFTTRHLFGLAEVRGTLAMRTGQIRGGKWTVSGALPAHGISRPLDLVIDQAHCSGGEMSLRAQARIDRYDFGVTAAKVMAARHLRPQVQVVAHADDQRES